MRTMIVAAASVITISFATFAITPAHAVGVRYPFCMQGDRYPGLSYCTFETYEQCKATASGIGQDCIANPYYAGDNDPRSYINVPPREHPDYGFFNLFIH